MATSGGIWRELQGEQVRVRRRKGSRGLPRGGGMFELGHAGEPGFLHELLEKV